MPLDTLQFEVLATLLPNRSPQSVVAGGSVLHRHAFRLSDDQDIFHSDGLDIAAIADVDVATLRSAGFDVEYPNRAPQEGLIEVTVYKEGFAPTKLQWVQSGLWNFFSAVEDEVFGWRLHMLDIAINKVLAAASRHEARDFVDLSMIHEHVVPLWVAIWAAPGKDAGFNPLSLIERLSRHNHFPQVLMDNAVDSLVPIDAGNVLAAVANALDEAKNIIPRLPMGLVGNLFVDDAGNVATNIDEVLAGIAGSSLRPLGPVADGAWPSGPEIDRIIIARLVDAFGLDGSEIPMS